MIALLAAIAALLSIAVAAIGAMMYALLQQNGRLIVRLEALEGGRSLPRSRINRNGLAAGTMAPDFDLPALDGGQVTRSEYAGRWLLLVFSDPECAPCQALLPRLDRATRTAKVSVLLVSRGDADANRQKMAEARVTLRVALQRNWEVSRLYGMFATPIAYLVDPNGRIAEDVATGGQAILALVARAQPERASLAGDNAATRVSVH